MIWGILATVALFGIGIPTAGVIVGMILGREPQ